MIDRDSILKIIRKYLKGTTLLVKPVCLTATSLIVDCTLKDSWSLCTSENLISSCSLGLLAYTNDVRMKCSEVMPELVKAIVEMIEFAF